MKDHRMTHYSRRAALTITACAAVSACAVPRGAPQRSEVLRGADATADGTAPDFALVVVSRAELGRVARWPRTGTVNRTHWPRGGNGPAAPVIRAGDRLDLRIWDSEAGSLVTSDGERVTELPGLTVSPSGEIFLPYVDDVQVAGLTPDVARRRVQTQLERIIPSAQVQLTLVSGRANAVDMVGGVNAPGNYPFEEANVGILAMISAAGGVRDGMTNPQVRLMRGTQVFTIALSELFEDPARDVSLRGRDRIIIEDDKRFFMALGAAGREEVIPFDRAEISALRAVSMMGGMADNRADPRGVLVLRRYDPGQVGGDGQPPLRRVVFSFDLTSADGLFSADEFTLNSGDVVLATQAPATTTERVLGLFGSFLGAGRTASNL